MKIKDFIKVFGESGHSARFEGCTAKNGDKATGEYKVEANEVLYTYTDKKERT
ncbi:MAG TPA: hypothetical protein PKU82_03330 [Bacteroidia bacterium]|nr:hypothetical protein [Bacteroidia bacterium]HOZ90685.1 hypothetical protein [Bacteroidia bacterium]HRB52099.1 hypothetical protein [Bacteroidia bacterium]